MPDLGERLLDALGGGGCDALVEGKCLIQAGDGFAGVAVVEVGAADTFQGACFFRGAAELAGDGQCLGVVVVGPARRASRKGADPQRASLLCRAAGFKDLAWHDLYAFILKAVTATT